MRWRHVDPAAAQENAARAQVLARIDAWWEAFVAAAPEIGRLFHRQSTLDLPRWMAEHLGALHPEIMWEFGPALREGHRLVLTPEAQRHLRPLVWVILSRAPSISGWEFYGHRLPELLPQASATVQGRVGQQLEGFRACVTADDGGVNITYWSPRVREMEEDQARGLAFAATESLLGEECLDTFVDVIDAADRPVGADVDLAELRAGVEARIQEQRLLLPASAFVQVASEAAWTLLKLKPQEADDYPGQYDLFVAKTVHLPMWQRAHSLRAFSSSRYSRCGETFAYVKLDGSEGIENEGFADKSEIEDALDAALRPKGFGAHVGGGTGLRYSYVDLALTDVERAIPVIRDVLRGGRVPKRSWLLFFDDDLADEWIGIWDDSPQPPS